MPERLAVERQQDRARGRHAKPGLQILKQPERFLGKAPGTIERLKLAPPARARATVFRFRQRAFRNRANGVYVENAGASSAVSQ